MQRLPTPSPTGHNRVGAAAKLLDGCDLVSFYAQYDDVGVADQV